MHSHRSTQKSSIAIVGGETLLGKEVRDLLEASKLATVKLIAAEVEDGSAIISRTEDEPIIINSLLLADIGTARAVMLAGSPASSRVAYEKIKSEKPAPVVIDISGGLEDHPSTRLLAPHVEAVKRPEPGAIQLIAHPAAIALAQFLIQLRKSGAIRGSVIEIFEPVSERGQAGIDELQKQTVGLLSFKPLPKDLFDAQVSFNMLPRFGSEARHSLEEIELKIDRHLASLLAGAKSIPMPSLRLIHAPVFHGYSMCIWVEFEKNPDITAIEKSLASTHIDVRTNEHEPPSNAAIAGQSGITVGAVTADRNNPRAAWFWLVADNLRIAAENAVEAARGILP